MFIIGQVPEPEPVVEEEPTEEVEEDANVGTIFNLPTFTYSH